MWIISARWDVFVCLSTVWFPLLVWAGWQLAAGADIAAAETITAVAVVGLSIPHFLTTFTFTYLDAALEWNGEALERDAEFEPALRARTMLEREVAVERRSLQ